MPRFIIRPVALLLLTFVCFTPDARADALVIDPVGDTFGVGPIQHDITSVNATATSTSLTFVVTFAGQVFAPSAANLRSVGGFIDIDADQNAATGVGSATGVFGPPPAPLLGVEFGIDLFSEAFHPGLVDVINVNTGAFGTAPIIFSATSFTLTVPLSLLGGDDGLVNYALVIGTFGEPTDEVPNGAAPATSAPIPEPTTMLLLGTGLAGVGAAVRRRRRAGKG